MIDDELTQPDLEAQVAAQARADDILRPAGALARLDELAVWVAGWQANARPRIDRPAALVFAGDHGVVAEGVTAYPAEVTASMLAAFEQQVATISALGRAAGVEVRAVDVGVGLPTGNLAAEPALDEDRLRSAMTQGGEAVAELADDGADLVALGEMGIGNTTAAAAICTTLLDGGAADWVGRGAGVDDDGLARKQAVVDRAVARLGDDTDPLRVLAELGGTELAAIAGATLEARRRALPVVLDGYICTAAVLPLHQARPGVLDHCRAGHRSAEPGHGRLLAAIGMEPILELDLRLGEGSGAVAAVPLIRMACAALSEVPTFSEWFG
ncbi:MAG: nicotinate-nucleotide--dimethylbenzimidazole phosphoribosyltransferase, partial [Acidimicrobiia bacterium]|nr:nicotinate-nucleotide--dimethylbenzimidazole phosphoribosyltransferase [Acidimicrobiia bacterium]